MTKIVCLSDTHSQVENIKDFQIPEGDILIHAGDFCGYSQMADIYIFTEWFAKQPHKHKVLIAGNHDWPCQVVRSMCETIFTEKGIHYLQDRQVVLEGVSIYGTPWQPEFNNWAFNLPKDSNELKERWKAIPTKTDILVTHCPPLGILDKIVGEPERLDRLGCPHLYEQVTHRIHPKLHVFGHIHTSHGVEEIESTTYVNASLLNEKYEVTFKPIVVEI